MLNFLELAFGTINKVINNFFEQHKFNIYCAAGLVLLINVLIAIPFTLDYTHTGLVRNFLVFGAPYHQGSFAEFAKYGIQWLAFVDAFILIPSIIWSMVMPSLVELVKRMQQQEEE